MPIDGWKCVCEGCGQEFVTLMARPTYSDRCGEKLRKRRTTALDEGVAPRLDADPDARRPCDQSANA